MISAKQKTMFGSSLPPHIVLCFYFAYLRLLYSMLPVSLDGPFLIVLRYSLTFIYNNIYYQVMQYFGKNNVF